MFSTFFCVVAVVMPPAAAVMQCCAARLGALAPARESILDCPPKILRCCCCCCCFSEDLAPQMRDSASSLLAQNLNLLIYADFSKKQAVIQMNVFLFIAPQTNSSSDLALYPLHPTRHSWPFAAHRHSLPGGRLQRHSIRHWPRDEHKLQHFNWFIIFLAVTCLRFARVAQWQRSLISCQL